MRQSAASYYSEILQQGQKERDVERAFEAQIGEHCDQHETTFRVFGHKKKIDKIS